MNDHPYHCSQCGSPMIYRPEKQWLECPRCATVFTDEERYQLEQRFKAEKEIAQ